MLDKCKEEIACKPSPSSVGDRKLEELTHQLESERSSCQVLVKKFDDQVLITNKTELALNTQTDLINAKNENHSKS